MYFKLDRYEKSDIQWLINILILYFVAPLSTLFRECIWKQPEFKCRVEHITHLYFSKRCLWGSGDDRQEVFYVLLHLICSYSWEFRLLWLFRLIFRPTFPQTFFFISNSCVFLSFKRSEVDYSTKHFCFKNRSYAPKAIFRYITRRLTALHIHVSLVIFSYNKNERIIDMLKSYVSIQIMSRMRILRSLHIPSYIYDKFHTSFPL